jgi:response regulator NasT
MDGIEVARCIAESHDAAVVILTAFSQRELIDQAIEAGALAYLVKPFQRSELVPAVEIARARHREMRAITHQAQTLADRLEARKTIDRARGVLMDEVGLSETDAFRFIQQAAMNERANMADVARQVLEDGRRPES